MKAPLTIHPSPLAGSGACATRIIRRGERICIMAGEEITLLEYARRLNKKVERSGDGLQVAAEKYIDLEERYRNINHSCNPNAGIRNKNELVAIRRICRGEEITYDYSTTMWENPVRIKEIWPGGLWTMPCRCRAEACRKIIGQFYDLPGSIQRKYLRLKAVPDFIVRKLGA